MHLLTFYGYGKFSKNIQDLLEYKKNVSKILIINKDELLKKEPLQEK